MTDMKSSHFLAFYFQVVGVDILNKPNISEIALFVFLRVVCSACRRHCDMWLPVPHV